MYDLIIIGGGPGGYVAAERAGAAGKKVLLIEQGPLGGVCLNQGCIPTKTLLHCAKTYAHARESEALGVSAEKVSFNLETAMRHKAKVVDALRKGVAAAMKRHGVELVAGSAALSGARRVKVAGNEYEAAALIIATGSRPAQPPIPGLDAPDVLGSTGLLEIKKLPASLAIVGGGYIGMEFASLFSMLGVQVSVIEMLEEIVPSMDRELAALLRKSLPAVSFELGARVERLGGGRIEFSRGGESRSLPAELTLVSTGRRPNLENLGLEAAGVAAGPKGIQVDEYMRTSAPGVYAVGDVTGRALLAHAASRMGEVAVNHILGRPDRMRYEAMPWAVFSSPEAAGCGLTEAEALARGLKIKTANVPFRLSGRYLAEHGREQGRLKAVLDAESGVLLGLTMLGSGCSELVFGAAMAVENELRAGDIREIIFPHPTMSEVMREAMFEIEE